MTPLTAAAPAPDWRLGAVLVLLVATAAAASRVAGTGIAREQAQAAGRALVQLAVVALVIAAALGSLGWSAAFVAVMYTVATATSARRVGVPLPQWPWVGGAIAAGAAPVVGLCLGSGVIPLQGEGVIPMAGIIIGGAMTAATLTGRRAFDELSSNHGAYEAGLALGLDSPEAAHQVVQPSAREALMPGLDQTRTVGLVTLPGAFVGVLLGGGTALEAGAAQALVLIGLLATQAVTSAVLLRLVCRGLVVRRDLAATFPR